MSEFIKTQQELRANLTSQIREVIDSAEAEKRGLDAAELEKIDRIEADIRRADEAIAVAQRNEERALEASVAAKGFALPETSERSASDVLRQIASTRGAHTFTREERILVPSTNTVPKSFFDEVFDVARLVGPMLDVGQRINTTSGEDITLPTLTAYSTATLKSAGSAIDESEPTYSSIVLGAYKYGLLIPVANELIADAGFNISAHLAEQAGNGLGFAVNAALTTGDGTNKPNGVVTAAGSGVTGGTGVSGAFTADNLIDLQYTLDGAARRLPGVAYMAAGQAIGAMRKLKDSAGNYLYTVNVGQPDNFAGYSVIENPGMANTGTGAKSVLFGHLPSYKVRVAGGIQVATSTDYAFNTDSTYFRVMMRVDGDLTHASHIKYFIGAAS
jgi:HK97 family phage major capsid protein